MYLKENAMLCLGRPVRCYIYGNSVYCESYGTHKSTIWAEYRDLVLNLAVHTTGLQKTNELPFTVSQTVHVKTGVIYIFMVHVQMSMFSFNMKHRMMIICF